MTKNSPQIAESWKLQLANEFQQAYFQQLQAFLLSEKKYHTIYPPEDQIFAAFNHTPFSDVKVVIIGQDPYHGAGQANGLCFSVPDGIKKPPSLINIFKEIHQDLGLDIPESGNLENWAQQGVLLLNATLTVRAKNAGSHQKQGWEQFTDACIRKLSLERESLIFMLWGRFAQNKAELIDTSKHHILTAPHPSPFSAHSGFFGCSHFSKTNELLEQMNKPTIQWIK
ncbi:MAG: uracil-DNA glycosylase [Flavobacteriales bacterium]|nr:uracil-DNA glycosylase [Flavobacteriales bacterium]|tara:strand:+ start:18550 stop:19227 length:678 start_codon:yes stop_codon:yes gene_type:complete